MRWVGSERGEDAGDSVANLFKVQVMLNKHGNHCTVQPHVIPVWLMFH